MKTLAALILGTAVVAFAGHDLLDLEFNDGDSLGRQPGGLPKAVLLHDMSVAAGAPGAADFGNAGRMQIASFPHPITPFTMEARFKLRSYGASNSNYISDLVNTATWESGPIQGMVFRVGGGLLYPPLRREAYATEEQYQRSLSQVDNGNRASISRCLAELAIAAKPGGTAQWLEVYTNRCVEPDQWTHLAAVWDGHAMRIYLNGCEATDKWRINGAGSQPALDPTALLTVGARYDNASDERHFNGIMDFVRMVDTAMSEKQIRQRYRDTFTPEELKYLCRGFIFPNSPAPGELTGGGSIFLFNLQFHAACSDSLGDLVLRPGDSVDVEIARDPLFQDVLLRFTVGDTTFKLDELQLAAQLISSRECYWRARLRRAGTLAKSGARFQETEWSSPTPFFWEADPSRVSAHPPGAPFRRVLWQAETGMWLPDNGSGKAPILFLPSGRRADLRFRREARGWRADPSAHTPSGVLLLAAPGAAGHGPR